MSVFDPLGFLLHVIIQARILFQDIWRSKIGWDDEVEVSHYAAWQTWLSELNSAANITIPRWILTEDFDNLAELHIFCDASSRAFASVAYLRSRKKDGTWHVAFLMARARVAPLKVMSIPRLELQAAVMGARMSQHLRQCEMVPLSKLTLWSDSKTVLSWLNSDSGRFKPFVAHRVSEVTDLTEVTQWRWVPSHLNAADSATRDSTTVHSEKWIQGPTFLTMPDEQWPDDVGRDFDTDFIDADDKEVKAVLFTAANPVIELPDVKRFSKYWRFVRSTAWFFRAIDNFKTKKPDWTRTELSALEVTTAEEWCVKESQRRSFAVDINHLKRHGHVDSSSSLRQLNPFLDSHDLLRVGGRIDAANVHYDARHPVILHPSDYFTKLLLQRYHEDSAHSGRERILQEIRKQFWIVNGRNAVKKTFYDCLICRINRAKSVAPLMGQLPDCRVNRVGRPFTHTGIDYFGPMLIKIGRRHEKRWGVLYTCMTVRAVYVDLVSDLTTSSAILSLRRFIARRGCPAVMYSDNATTFRGADKELKQAVMSMDRGELLRFGSVRNMEWKFIPPNAPHMGGCWERLVRSIKTALRTTLKERVPSEQTLLTLLAEAEYFVNSRPLTYIPLGCDDSPALTPNDFLFTDTNFIDRPFGQFTDGDMLRRSWRESQRLADLTWKRWVREYLPTLTRRDKWFKADSRPLAVGDIVIVADDQLPRAQLYTRPATKLCRLDVGSQS
ncbi:uncharacterized protein LOC114353554 [Ostrinia furnacalis]|uniref:uncharacterized protein LOC114353554 n=2 Tax=Ostrinia furnacalis TaxID=93504 RepID=UPI00103EE669|nr:uncharacterized protein LOC114353554 [Ostrinia furnacalis]